MKVASNGIKRLTDDARQKMLNLSEWMIITKFKPNPQNTEFLAIEHPQKIKHPSPPESPVLVNQSLKRVTHTKSLELIVDETTTFSVWNGMTFKVIHKL